MIYISLGSNLGNKQKNLESAVIEIKKITADVKQSAFYLTEPLGDADQAAFLNAVVECSCSLNPLVLLHKLQEIENKEGRFRDPERRYGPRTLDLDILLFNNECLNSRELTLPHPRLTERCFALIPLIELNNHIKHPETGILFSKYLNDLNGQSVEPYIYRYQSKFQNT